MRANIMLQVQTPVFSGSQVSNRTTFPTLLWYFMVFFPLFRLQLHGMGGLYVEALFLKSRDRPGGILF